MKFVENKSKVFWTIQSKGNWFWKYLAFIDIVLMHERLAQYAAMIKETFNANYIAASEGFTTSQDATVSLNTR